MASGYFWRLQVPLAVLEQEVETTTLLLVLFVQSQSLCCAIHTCHFQDSDSLLNFFKYNRCEIREMDGPPPPRAPVHSRYCSILGYMSCCNPGQDKEADEVLVESDFEDIGAKKVESVDMPPLGNFADLGGPWHIFQCVLKLTVFQVVFIFLTALHLKH